MNRTTPAHFKVFTKEILRLMKVFGLQDWKPYFYHQNVQDGRASCSTLLAGRTASFRLSLDWGDEPTVQAIKSTAKHETLELLVAPLEILASARFVTADEIREAAHAIIRRLEKFNF